MATTIELKCSECGIEFEKKIGEYNRKKKNGNTKFYCGLKCSSKNNTTDHLKDYRGKYADNLKMGSERDEYSGFRNFINRAKRRNRGCDITVKYLKEIWDYQNGKCIHTDVDLVLPESTVHCKIENPNYAASLDRIDSSKGYMVGNVQFISLTTNYAKNAYGEETLLEYFEIINKSIIV